MERIRLGKSDVYVSPLGLGTWAWGDTSVWDYGESYDDEDLMQSYNASLESGINFIDTAEAYAEGKSESIIGRFVSETSTRKQVIIATKFVPSRLRILRSQLVAALRRSLRRLGLSHVDLYQIHWPGDFIPIETWMHALADAVEAGLTRAVGVSNFSVEETKRAHAILAARGVPLASNQIPYNLLHSMPQRNGMADLCRELDVTIIAHSPLCQGMLGGKFTPTHPPPGLRGRKYDHDFLIKTKPLLGLMKEIGHAHDGKSPAQVALNWTMCKGAVPIPGAKNVKQARENLGSHGWRLSDGEVRALDKASEAVQI